MSRQICGWTNYHANVSSISPATCIVTIISTVIFCHLFNWSSDFYSDRLRGEPTDTRTFHSPLLPLLWQLEGPVVYFVSRWRTNQRGPYRSVATLTARATHGDQGLSVGRALALKIRCSPFHVLMVVPLGHTFTAQRNKSHHHYVDRTFLRSQGFAKSRFFVAEGKSQSLTCPLSVGCLAETGRTHYAHNKLPPNVFQ